MLTRSLFTVETLSWLDVMPQWVSALSDLLLEEAQRQQQEGRVVAGYDLTQALFPSHQCLESLFQDTLLGSLPLRAVNEYSPDNIWVDVCSPLRDLYLYVDHLGILPPVYQSAQLISTEDWRGRFFFDDVMLACHVGSFLKDVVLHYFGGETASYLAARTALSKLPLGDYVKGFDYGIKGGLV